MFYAEHSAALLRSRRLLRSCRRRRSEMRFLPPNPQDPWEYKRLGECMWFVAAGYKRSYYFLAAGQELYK